MFDFQNNNNNLCVWLIKNHTPEEIEKMYDEYKIKKDKDSKLVVEVIEEVYLNSEKYNVGVINNNKRKGKLKKYEGLEINKIFSEYEEIRKLRNDMNLKTRTTKQNKNYMEDYLF